MDNSGVNEPQQNPAISNAPGNQAPSPFFHSSSSDEDGESGETSSLEVPANQQCPPPIVPNETASIDRHRKNSNSASGPGKFCRVCGDKALGYNFNVISCESCKAFFRRNALKKKEFVCPFTNNCDVTYVSRRFCQKCRLRKCFEVGMNPDWIMSDEALAAKRRRRNESSHTALEKLQKISPAPRKITPATGYPRVASVEPILIAANSADGLSMLANCASPAPPVQQQQFALLTTQPGGPKVITIVPVQQLQQSTTPLTQAKLDPSYGASSSNAIVAGNGPSNASSVVSSIANFIQNQPAASVKSDDGTINIPKDVLINLITKCHSGADTNATSQDAHSKTALSKNRSVQCCCKCTCGAKPVSDPIGIEKSDKMISTEDLPLDRSIHANFGSGFLSNSAFGPTASLASVPTSGANRGTSASPLDFSTASSLSRGCRSLSQHHMTPSMLQQHHQASTRQQQSMYEDVLDAAIISVFHDGNQGMATSNFGVPSIPTGSSSALGYSIGQHRQLSSIERQRLEELLAANEVMKEPLEGMNEQRIYEGHNVDPKLMDVINMTDIAVRRIIKMNKRIEAFRNLCQEDQIALLKGGCTELMILRGIMTYDPEKDSWLTRVHNTGHEYIKLEVLKGVKGNVYEEHKKYVQSFPATWRTSEPIMIILGAITLFNPGRPNIVHKEMIKLEQQFYYELLKNYLSTIYSPREAEEAHSGLVERLGTLHRVNEFAASIFLDINPKDVEPLLIEIFDLKK